jgi:hypothetical protein
MSSAPFDLAWSYYYLRGSSTMAKVRLGYPWMMRTLCDVVLQALQRLDVECFIYFGGKVPDCVFQLFFRVSFVKVDGLVVI